MGQALTSAATSGIAYAGLAARPIPLSSSVSNIDGGALSSKVGAVPVTADIVI